MAKSFSFVPVVLLLGLLLVCSVPAYSDPPTVTISFANWQKLEQMQRDFAALSTLHAKTLNDGQTWRTETQKKLETWKSDYDKLLKDLEMEKEFSASLLTKMDDLSSRLTSLENSLKISEGIAVRLQTENTILKVGAVIAGIVAAGFAVAFFAK